MSFFSLTLFGQVVLNLSKFWESSREAVNFKHPIMRVTFSIARHGIGKRAKEEEEVHIFFVRTLFVIEFMEASIDEPLTVLILEQMLEIKSRWL